MKWYDFSSRVFPDMFFAEMLGNTFVSPSFVYLNSNFVIISDLLSHRNHITHPPQSESYTVNGTCNEETNQVCMTMKLILFLLSERNSAMQHECLLTDCINHLPEKMFKRGATTARFPLLRAGLMAISVNRKSMEELARNIQDILYEPNQNK